MTATSPLRVLVVGLGSIGQRHVRNLRRLLGRSVQISAYRVRGFDHVLTDDQRVEAPGGLATRHGLRLVESLEAGLSERPDAVFVTNPSSLHLETALEAARAGCALFVEKPLATAADRLDELAEEVRRRGLVATVGYQLRFHPGLARLALLLDDDRIGSLLAVRAVAIGYSPRI